MGQTRQTEEDGQQVDPSLRIFGKYFLVERLGGGGFGEVFRAQILGMDGYRDYIAIKILRANLRDRRIAEQTFRTEIALAKYLNHRNIVPVFETGVEMGRPYLAMPYIEGATLRTVRAMLRRAGRRLSPGTAAQIAGDIARGLGHAHNRRLRTGRVVAVVHRDVSPSNVLVGTDGVTRLIDFGVARLIGNTPQNIAGRPTYAPPEQLTGGAVNPAQDVYSLGVVLFEMLTGIRPFPPKMERSQLVEMKRAGPLEIPTSSELAVPDAMRELVSACTSPDGTGRPNAPEVADILDSLVTSTGMLGELATRAAREHRKRPFEQVEVPYTSELTKTSATTPGNQKDMEAALAEDDVQDVNEGAGERGGGMSVETATAGPTVRDRSKLDATWALETATVEARLRGAMEPIENLDIPQPASDVGVAKRVRGIPEFAIQKTMRRAAAMERVGRKLIRMDRGLSYRNTPDNIIEAAHRAMRAGRTGYTDSRGVAELRQAISAYTEGRIGVSYDPDGEILVTPGAKHAIYLAMMATLDPGDEVLLPNPVYTPSRMAAIATGATVKDYVLQPERNFNLQPTDLGEALTKRTKLFYLNSPHNPSGSVVDDRTLANLADVAVQGDLRVLSDEVYERFLYDGLIHRSIAAMDGMRERTIVVNSLSKTYSMAGWRVGWACGPEGLIRAMRKLQEASTTCVAAFTQYAAIEALTGSQEFPNQLLEELERNRDLLMDGLSRIDEVQITIPRGAMFCLADFRVLGLSSEALVRRLMEEAGVVAIPGTGFGDAAEGHVRLSFTGTEEELNDGIERIAQFVKNFAPPMAAAAE